MPQTHAIGWARKRLTNLRPLRYSYELVWVNKVQRCTFKGNALVTSCCTSKGTMNMNIPCLEPPSKTQHMRLCFVSVLLRTSCVHLNILPHTLSDHSDHLYAYECTPVTEHFHHHLHMKMLLPPAWCHWLRVTGVCSCHPSEPSDSLVTGLS